MMSSISPSEEQRGLNAKKSWKPLYDERVASIQTDGLSSSYDHPEITNLDVNFTPCPRNHMSKKALSTSRCPQIDDVDGQAKRRCVIEYQAATAVDIIFFGSNPGIGDGWRYKPHVCWRNDRLGGTATGHDQKIGSSRRETSPGSREFAG